MKSITGNSQHNLEQCTRLMRDIDISQKDDSQSSQLLNFYKNIPATQLSDFNKALLQHLIDSFDSDKVSIKLTPLMADLNDNDLFVKDFAICSGRLLPIGPGLFEVAGVPRKILFTACWPRQSVLDYRSSLSSNAGGISQ